MKKFLIISCLVLLLSGCSLVNNSGTTTVEINNANNQMPATSSPANVVVDKTTSTPRATSTKSANTSSNTSTPQKVVADVPSQLVLPVAFAQQAPFGNWDALHEETCEEASMIMAVKYFNKQPLDETIMEAELQKLVKWEGENGYKVDLTAQETADILQNHFNLKARLSTEATANRIIYELAQGNLVLVPAAGRELGNPNFKSPGPIYHMLVIKGYNSSWLITNDPGTRKGNGFKYDYNVLIPAIHDWNHQFDGSMTPEQMNSGQKVIIIVGK